MSKEKAHYRDIFYRNLNSKEIEEGINRNWKWTVEYRRDRLSALENRCYTRECYGSWKMEKNETGLRVEKGRTKKKKKCRE